MRRAPLFDDTVWFGTVLLEAFEGSRGPRLLRERIQRGALRLIDDVTLATTGIDRSASLHAADAELQTLRIHLEIALELGLVTETFAIDAAEQSDRIGRQIGGWLRKLRADTVDEGLADRYH